MRNCCKGVVWAQSNSVLKFEQDPEVGMHWEFCGILADAILNSQFCH